MTPNTIKLIAKGRYDEAPALVDCFPGQIIEFAGGSGQVRPQSLKGAKSAVKVAIEDGLRGADITHVLPAGNTVRFYHAVEGDVYLFLLAIGQNVAKDDKLMNNGDGSLVAYSESANKLYQIVAPSAALSALAAETTFSNGTFTIPANYLSAGDVITIRGRVTVTAQNATDTNQIKVYLGATVLIDSGAVSLAANNVVEFEITLTFRTVGAAGTVVGSGWVAAGVAGTVTQKAIALASTAVDTTVAQVVTVKDTQSSNNAGNSARLDELEINEDYVGVDVRAAVVQAAEAINNSVGSSVAFIRGRVL